MGPELAELDEIAPASNLLERALALTSADTPGSARAAVDLAEQLIHAGNESLARIELDAGRVPQALVALQRGDRVLAQQGERSRTRCVPASPYPL